MVYLYKGLYSHFYRNQVKKKQTVTLGILIYKTTALGVAR